MSDAQFYERLEQGDLPGALEVFDSVEDRDAAVDTLQEICEEHLDVNDWDQLQLGLKVCDVVVPLAPERSDVHFWKLQALSRLGKFDDAFAFAREHKDRPIMLFELFEMSCVHGKYDDAEALLPELAEHEHSGAGKHFYNLGCKLHGSGANPQALALFEGAIASGHPLPQSAINAGVVALLLNRTAKAEEFARTGLEVAPREPNLWANLVDATRRGADADAIHNVAAEAVPILGSSSRCDECDYSTQVAACGVGCGALLDDVMEAMIQVGDHRAALDLYDSHSAGDDRIQSRVVFSHARALAAAGDADKANVVLDAGIPGDDVRGSVAFYRARAAAAFAGGDRDRAFGALAAAINIDDKCAHALREDPAWELLEGNADLAAGKPIRPPQVPAEAWWDSDDWGEWVAADKDAQGRKQGLVRYWRADGTLCCECEHVDDEPNGHSKRYHELGGVSQEADYVEGKLHGTRIWYATDKTTTERMHVEGMSHDIRRSEMEYDQDRVTVIRHYLGDGRMCAADGTPYPDRPESVPDTAFYNPDEEIWRFGEVDENNKGRGTWRSWNSSGQLIVEEELEDGERHGSYRALFSDGNESAVGEYDEGSKTGTFTYYRRGEEEHDDFPICGSKVVRVVALHGETEGTRFFDAEGRETMIDGTPLDELPALHPALADVFERLEGVSWSELEDAGGAAHTVPQIVIGLLAQDEGDDEEISDSVYGDLYWHLCHQGTIYSATAAALPFIIEIAAYENTPHRAALLSFVSNCCSASRSTLEQARDEEWEVFLAAYEALVDNVDSLLKVLEQDDPVARCAATRAVSGAHDRAADVEKALLAMYERDDDPRVKSSALFALGRLATDSALSLLEQRLSDDTQAGACAAMALVMASGAEVSEAVTERLIAEFEHVDDRAESFSELPWADDHLMSELAQALAYGGGGSDEVLPALIERFDSVDSISALSLVQAAIMIAVQQGQGLTEEVAAVLSGLVESEKPWTFDVTMREILGRFNLPPDRDGLRELIE